MSVGIVRVQKFTAGSVKGIEIHDRREKEGVSHSNQDINWERTPQNYDLHPAQNLNFRLATKERIGQLELKKAVRKDAIVMGQVLVTSDHEYFSKLSIEQQKSFFADSYEFLKKRYGPENVISSTVHLDEHTPHMHFNFVPVTEDDRLSAKDVLNKQALIDQQTKFFEDVGAKHGLERGLNKQQRIEQGKQRKNFTMPEYKSLMADIQQKERERENLAQKALEAQKAIEALENKEKALTAQIRGLESQIRAITMSWDEVDAIKPQKALGGAVRGVSVEVIENLKDGLKRSYSLRIDNERLMQENDRLNKQIPSPKQKMLVNDEMSRLRQIERAFQLLPQDEQQRLLQSLGRSPSKGQER